MLVSSLTVNNSLISHTHTLSLFAGGKDTPLDDSPFEEEQMKQLSAMPSSHVPDRQLPVSSSSSLVHDRHPSVPTPDRQPPIPAHAPVPDRQPLMPAHTTTLDPQPALEDVHAHIKTITGCIQELLKAAQSQRQNE